MAAPGGSGMASASVSASAAQQAFTKPAVAVRGTTTGSTVVNSLTGASVTAAAPTARRGGSAAPPLLNPTLTSIDPAARADKLIGGSPAPAPPPGAVGRAATQGASWLGLNTADFYAAGVGSGADGNVSRVPGKYRGIEPPDQGLCVGNGFVVETVNALISVYSAAGGGRLALTSLEGFLGLLPAGWSLAAGATLKGAGDPSCAFDRATRRWYHVLFLQSSLPSVSERKGSGFGRVRAGMHGGVCPRLPPSWQSTLCTHQHAYTHKRTQARK
jgi:hypothetical protein